MVPPFVFNFTRKLGFIGKSFGSKELKYPCNRVSALGFLLN